MHTLININGNENLIKMGIVKKERISAVQL